MGSATQKEPKTRKDSGGLTLTLELVLLIQLRQGLGTGGGKVTAKQRPPARGPLHWRGGRQRGRTVGSVCWEWGIVVRPADAAKVTLRCLGG